MTRRCLTGVKEVKEVLVRLGLVRKSLPISCRRLRCFNVCVTKNEKNENKRAKSYLRNSRINYLDMQVSPTRLQHSKSK